MNKREALNIFEYQRIYVAVDGSRESDYAFEKAMAICLRNHVEKLTAIHVLDKSYRISTAEIANHAINKEAAEFSQAVIAKYTEKAKVYNIPCEILLREGTPSSTLLKEFKGLNEDDLVICGSSNLGRIGRLLLGSVSTHIVQHASCDVLVVRTPERIMVKH